jgi:serine/threonine protein kinase
MGDKDVFLGTWFYNDATPKSERKAKANTKYPKLTMVGDYIVSKTLGKGSFSKVKLGIHQATKKKVRQFSVEKKKCNIPY